MAWRSGAVQEGDPGWGVTSSEGSASLTALCQSPVGTAKLLCTGPQQLWVSLDLHLHWAMNKVSDSGDFPTISVLTYERIAFFLHCVLAVIKMQRQILTV